MQNNTACIASPGTAVSTVGCSAGESGPVGLKNPVSLTGGEGTLSVENNNVTMGISQAKEDMSECNKNFFCVSFIQPFILEGDPHLQ